MTGLYLSLDESLDDGDWLMSREISPGVVVRAEVPHNGVLNPGESYIVRATVTLPFELQGPMHVIAMADSGPSESGYRTSSLSPRLRGVAGDVDGSVREFEGEGNNTTSQAVTLTAYSPARSYRQRSHYTAARGARAEVHGRIHRHQQRRRYPGVAGPLGRSGLPLARSVPGSHV